MSVEIDTLWVRDERGRLLRNREADGGPAPYLVIACDGEGRLLELGSAVPDELAEQLQRAVESTPRERDPSTAPAALDRCGALLREWLGAVEVASGPSYLVAPDTAFPSDVEITHSGSPDAGTFRDRNPAGANWRPREWGELIAGTLGPWAFATVAHEVIAICHCARLWERGAEAGVWTHPGYRGRGYAAAVTSAWASLAATRDRHLFYSTSAENKSSQRVAERLRLRTIGWMWKLTPTSR